jgi:hypothetical protein
VTARPVRLMTRDEVLIEVARIKARPAAWDVAVTGEPYIVPPSRPWWWWLALAFAIGLSLIESWVIFRTLAGWPIGAGLLSRLAG